MLKHHQVKPYDDASKELRTIAETIGKINVAGFELHHRQQIERLMADASQLGAEMYRLCYERFLAERSGDVKPGE